MRWLRCDTTIHTMEDRWTLVLEKLLGPSTAVAPLWRFDLPAIARFALTCRSASHAIRDARTQLRRIKTRELERREAVRHAHMFLQRELRPLVDSVEWTDRTLRVQTRVYISFNGRIVLREHGTVSHPDATGSSFSSAVVITPPPVDANADDECGRLIVLSRGGMTFSTCFRFGDARALLAVLRLQTLTGRSYWRQHYPAEADQMLSDLVQTMDLARLKLTLNGPSGAGAQFAIQVLS